MGRWSKPHWARLLLPQSNPGFFTSLPNQSVKQFCYISPNSQSFDLHESFLCVLQFFNISNIHQFKEQEWLESVDGDLEPLHVVVNQVRVRYILSFNKVAEGVTSGPIDQTPGIPGSDKNSKMSF